MKSRLKRLIAGTILIVGGGALTAIQSTPFIVLGIVFIVCGVVLLAIDQWWLGL